MIVFFIATGCSVILAIALLFYSVNCSTWDDAAGVIGVLVAGVALIGIIFSGVTAFGWYGAQYKATIINREYNTSYSREEVFYASNVIDTIRQLDRERVEINGDILKK